MLRQTSLEHQVTRGLWQEEKTNQHNRRKHQRRTHHETPPSVHLVEDSSNGVPQNLSKSNTELIERNKTPTLVTGHRLTNVHTNTTTFDTHTNPQNKSSRIHDVLDLWLLKVPSANSFGMGRLHTKLHQYYIITS